ncbi:DUF2334 domain-containing protein [Candidatus Uhrbacteria bacterium]|nr:DUF2334 domain-containing protein [Candidatus Uhrbacteria bacterium]
MSLPIFRIDDIGASTKAFEQYGNRWFRPFSNFGPLKRIPPFRMWGPYQELTADQWLVFLQIFREHHIVPIIAITATWVDENSHLIPFPEKFPDEANTLKQAADRHEIIIANHGLTHCVVGKHLPRPCSSNRSFHREFLPTLDQEVHTQHICASQKILETFFDRPIEMLVPPGNVWSIKTYHALQGTNIKKIMCSRHMVETHEEMEGVQFIDDHKGVVRFHDRELCLFGEPWLRRVITQAVSVGENSSRMEA